jgi:homoserine O-acetyltransferase
MPTYIHPHPVQLEGGAVLPQLEIAYHTYGTFQSGKSKVIWVCHALTANSDVASWWPNLFGPNSFFDVPGYFIVCANVLGSCYGTTGPLSINPETQAPYLHQFPDITIRDIVQAHELLRQHLGIEEIYLGIGGSLGGQQLLEWSILKPTLFLQVVAIATNALHSPWGIAFNETQRMAIRTDPTWASDDPQAGIEGMKVARAIALLSYRHYDTYQQTQQDEQRNLDRLPKAVTYQWYQGEKLAQRFNAFSYYVLSKAMDSHDVGRGRASAAQALQQIEARTLIIGLHTDILFPADDQRFLFEHIPDARFELIYSAYGHDGFLTETEQLRDKIDRFLAHNQLVHLAS